MSDLPKIGIDIGAATIKLVELAPVGRDAWKMVTAASIPTPTGGINSPVAVTAAIVKLLREAGAKSRRVVAALPEDQVSSHVVNMPTLSDDEVKSAIRWQVEQYIPIPADRAVWSYEIVSRDKSSGEMEILLMATSKVLVATYTQILQQAGLEVVALETEMTASARACVPDELTTSMIVDIGAKSTDVGVVSRGQLVFSRTIPVAGDAFTRSIESGLGLDSGVAEQYKSTYGLSQTKLDGKLVEAMKPVLNEISAEIKKTCDFYLTKHPLDTIKLITISGGAAQLVDMVGMLSGLVGIEVAVANPFAKVHLDTNQTRAVASTAVYYCVAAGLAMRRIEP
ncbi:MAG: type IV pilus assembly protein PilM [Patescibacteria group bacterium]